MAAVTGNGDSRFYKEGDDMEREVIENGEMELQEFNLLGIYTYADLLSYLQKGYRAYVVRTHWDGTKYLDDVCHADSRYIYWNAFGSSANRATAKDMQFVVEKIFRTTLDEFIRYFILF